MSFSPKWLGGVGARPAVAFAGLLALTSAGQGQVANCGDPENDNTCAMQTGEAAEAAMSEAYRKLESMLQGVQLKQLRRSQAAWLAFRDADCAFAEGWFVPSDGAETDPANCRAEHARIRYERLITYVAND